LLFPQQITFEIGDNIRDYLDRNPAIYLTQGDYLLNSPDGRVDFLKYKAETSDADTKFLVQGSNVFGVMQYEDNATYILYDLTGNGVLDVYFNSLFIPFWVLSESGYTKTSGNNNIVKLLDNGLMIMNSNENPYANDAMRKHVMEFASYIDVSAENRDLFYGMLEYYNFSQYPSLAIMLMSELGIRYNSRFGSIHPLIYLHLAESLINLGNGKQAENFINAILATNPDFIPAKVYSWQLETDSVRKQIKYNDLKTKNPNHWIVVQI